MRIEKEREARRKSIDIETTRDRCFDVREAVSEGERELLRGGRTGFTNVIARDRDRVPLRHLGRAELDHVDDDAHVRSRRKDPLFLRDVLFENIRLNRSAEQLARDALLLGGGDVLRNRDCGRPIDRHRRGDVSHIDAVKERFHVAQRVDRDAALPDFAARLRRIGVIAHQRRHIERDRKPVLPLLEQKMIALVGLLGVAEAGELAHRPEPVAIPVRDGSRGCTDTRPAAAQRARRPAARRRSVSGTSEIVRSVAPEPGPVRPAAAGRSIILAKRASSLGGSRRLFSQTPARPARAAVARPAEP